MPRDLTSGMLTGIAADAVRPAIFVAIEFESGWVRVWSGLGSKVWNGETWLGVGNLGAISSISEPTEVRAEGIVVSLSGIPSGLVGSALADARQGKQVQVWFGLLEDDGDVIADPAAAFTGRCDVPVLEHGPETATIQISVESVLIDLERARSRRFTDEDQQAEFPGDRGFEFAAALALKGYQLGPLARQVQVFGQTWYVT